MGVGVIAVPATPVTEPAVGLLELVPPRLLVPPLLGLLAVPADAEPPASSSVLPRV